MFGQAQVDPFATQETAAISPLVLSSSSSSAGAGCHGTGVAEASSVCFSSDCPAPRSSGKSALGWSPAAASSLFLARPSMVLRPDFSPQRLSFRNRCDCFTTAVKQSILSKYSVVYYCEEEVLMRK